VYRQAFLEATVEAGDALEDRMMELAHDGNVTAAIFLLKGLRPNKYKERAQVELAKIQSLEDVPQHLMDQIIALLEKAAAEQEQRQIAAGAGGPTIDVKAAHSSELT
jgi:hypothetical protein